jgi:radical SAM-linked protein
MQRLRAQFNRGEEVKFISHLDLMRLWHRALRRAKMPLAYSEGFNPHPRISVAAPLALGVTSEAELMDVILSRPVAPHFFTGALNQQLPPGIRVLQAQQVALKLPSLQSLVRFAEYRVELTTGKNEIELQAAIQSLLALNELPWEHQRDTGSRRYDLRALIEDLWLISCDGAACTVGMRLRSDSRGSGRPEQVAAALGFPDFPCSIHRTRLVLQAP